MPDPPFSPRLLLIQPHLGLHGGKRYRTPALIEPLPLAVLAALTPTPWHVRAIDDRLEVIDFDEPVDLVALSVCTFSARRAYEIAAQFRQRHVPVVMGGFHPTLMPDEALDHADAVACGDAEWLWPTMCADFENGALRGIYRPTTSGPAPAVMPDRKIYGRHRYLPLQLVQFGRGCAHTCEYCSVRAYYDGKVAHRSVADVVAELRATRTRRILFVDDNFLADRAALVELLEAMIPLKKRWTCQIDLSFADDAKLVALAKKSGCQCVMIGFESLKTANLKQMGKCWNKVDSYRERLARIRRAGIMVYGSFLFGYDDDDRYDFDTALKFALEEKLALANFNPLQPLPGTPLYARMKAEGRLVFDRWWTDPRYHWNQALLHPTRLTTTELTAGCKHARERFHSFGSILRRATDFCANAASWANFSTYLITNLVSRWDIQAKTDGPQPKDIHS